MVKVTHYASSVHGQPNNNHPHANLRELWFSGVSASATNVTVEPKGSCFSSFNVKGKDYKKPWPLTGLDFQFNIPECAYIKNVKFEAMIKLDSKAKIPTPQGRFNFYHGTKSVKDTIKDDEGWENGYLYKHADKKNLSTSWQKITYEMTGSEFRKRGYPVSEINESRMGIDLRFYNPTELKKEDTVYVKYIKCTVDYELPNHVVTFKKSPTSPEFLDTSVSGDEYNLVTGNPTYLNVERKGYEVDVNSQSSPHNVAAGEEYEVVITHENRSNASCCNGNTRNLKITLPPNAKVVSANGNYNNGIWTVQCKANSKTVLKLRLKDYGIGKSKINVFGDDVGSYDYWVNTYPILFDVGEVAPYPGVMQKDILSCITFVAKANASDGVANFYCNLDTVHNSASNVIWTIDTEKTSDGVSLHPDSNDQGAYFIVPANEVVDIVWTGCFVPDFTGESNVSVRLEANPDVYAEYNVLPAPDFIVRNTPITTEDNREVMELIIPSSKINFKTHRLATSTEIEAYVIDCSYVDSTMIEEDCTLTASVWEKIDYIGMIPLEYHHYDPDSTYSNKAISDAYKNKTYKGKEGVIEEKISLKFKVRPKQAPTLQGLTKLDKPTPINANHKCFEGDPLNHRGWMVLSEVKFKRTNPLWYDCEAEVDYITHDIYTKFQIYNETRVNNKDMPLMMSETFSLGENLSTGLSYFNIDTDGGFIYDYDGEDGAKNIFSLDEGQHLSIATRNPLANVSHIRFDWYSNKIAEDRENNLERLFIIRDADGNEVFQYEYTNFQFYEDYITCDVIARVKTAGESWEINQETIDIRSELEADPIAVDEDEALEEVIDVDFEEVTEESEEEPSDVAYEESYIAPSFDSSKYDVTRVYGSSLEIVLNGNKLSIYDAGYNGRELAIEDISLIESGSYSFESLWTNKNADGMTEDIISYIDIGLSETLLSSNFAEYYSKLRVSPFPIPYKTVAFTRESEEGTIYYLTGDEPFKYRIEPFYQYHCGCDLVTREGVSIMDLNNSYTHYYIENGLVRFGFNKYNGRLYLAKFDIVSKEWITTHYFHMSEDTKFALESYSDDKIVIKAGTDTFFTIWRGRPFIGIKNPNEDIIIDSIFNYCLSDLCDGEASEYPRVYSFMNSNNLLPACIGGKKLDYDCFLLDDDDITSGTNHTLTITADNDNVADEPVTFTATLDPSTTDGNVHYLIDGVDTATVDYPFTYEHTFNKSGVYKVQAVYTGDDDDNIAFSDEIIVKVDTPEHSNDPKPELTGKYKLSIISAPKQFTYRDGKKVVLQLTKGGVGVAGIPVEIQSPIGATRTVYSGVNGKFEIVNSKVDVGEYQWGARLWDDGKLICKALRNIKIVKATPTITHNATQNKLNKGKSLHITLHGAVSVLTGRKITYTIGKGSKKTKTTNDKGKIYIPFKERGTFEIKIMYAGNSNYKSVSKKFNIKVV